MKERKILDFIAITPLSIAFYTYGYAKLNGTMFKNASIKVLETPLYKVDMFHLTWFWFDKNSPLSISIGVLQIIIATLLLFKQTRLIATMLAVPILMGILLIDVYCTNLPGLIIRIIFYLSICFYIFLINKNKIKALFIDENSYLLSLTNSINVKLLLKIILGIVIFQVLEALLVALSNLIMLI